MARLSTVRRRIAKADKGLWLAGLTVAGLFTLAAVAEHRAQGRRKKMAGDRPFGEEVVTDEPLKLQHRRAQQRGRGRRADAPWDIPWRGWKDILWRTYAEISNDRVLAVAAGVVFFALLALFPAVTAFVSVYGLVADAGTVSQQLSLIAGFAPQSVIDIVQEQMLRIATGGTKSLSVGFVFGLGLAIWSANAGMKAMIDALNVIYGEQEERGFVKLNLLSLAFTVGMIASFLFAVGAVVIFPVMLSFVGLGSAAGVLTQVLRWPALVLMILAGLAVLYRHGPDRRNARWQWVSVGSIVAAVTWLAGSVLLSWYLANFANYNATYGSLGAGIGLMMWLWLSSCVILVGAELNSEIEHQTARDSTIGRDKPLGRRGAAMADTVGAAQA
jgi:membrane protein